MTAVVAGAPLIATKARRREWIGLAVLALPCILYAMDLTVLDLAIPRLTADLHPSSTQLLWIVDIYGFVLAGLLIPMGMLGDRIGRRKLLLMGAAAFSGASVCAAFAPSAGTLIAARAVLGVAGATLAPSTLSLIRNMFLDSDERTKAIGVWVMSYSIGGALGPVVGGVLLERFWWGSVFLIGVPVMLLLLAVGPSLLPEFRDPVRRRIDLTSAGMSLTAVLLVIYGVKQLALSASPGVGAATIGAGIACGALFVRRQLTISDPIIDLALLRNRSFSVSLAAYTVTTLLSFGIYLFIVQYLQLVKGASPLDAAVVSLPVFAGFTAGSFASPIFARRFERTMVMIVGLGCLGDRVRVAGDRGSVERDAYDHRGHGDVRSRFVARVHAVDRSHHRIGAAGACGRGVRAVRDRFGARGRAWHRTARKRGRHGLSRLDESCEADWPLAGCHRRSA